jgi:hypothetical protein
MATSNGLIYLSLISLFLLITCGLYILFTIKKEIYFIYTGIKIFFLILFILWMNLYFTNRFNKMLLIDDENDNRENNIPIFQNLVNLFIPDEITKKK